MVIRMPDANLLALGEAYEQRRIEWEKANEDLPDDETLLEELASRLGIPLPAPERLGYNRDAIDPSVCARCGLLVPDDSWGIHVEWHIRLMAATKVAGWQANLAHMASQFLALSLREMLEQAEEWTPSGHGWIYPQGDPPGSIRARCGGPAMCDKCRADEQHSLQAQDGAAMAYYVARSIERGEIG